MGQALTSFIKALDDEHEAQTKETLKLLRTACENKLDIWQAELEAGFLDSSSIAKKQIPGTRAVRWEREYHVKVKNEPASSIDNAIDSFFGAGDSHSPGKEVAAGFKSLVKTALNVLLGNTEAGESETQKFFVFFQHNALVRIDVKMWRYGFSSKSLTDKCESAYAYNFCVSVVDHKKVTEDELTYLVSEFAGDENLDAYLNRLISVWRKMRYLSQDTAIDRFAPPPADQKRIKQGKKVGGQEEVAVRSQQANSADEEPVEE